MEQLYYWGVRPTVGTLWTVAKTSYLGIRAQMAEDAARRMGINPAAYDPQSSAYGNLNPQERARVDDRNRTRHASGLHSESVRPFLFLGPYYAPFDPARRDKYLRIKDASSAFRASVFARNSAVDGTRLRLGEIQNNTGPVAVPQLRRWYFVSPDLVFQSLFNLEANNTKLVLQMGISMRKQYTIYKKYIEHLESHIMWMVITGKDVSVFKDSLGTLLGKMMGEAYENEPLIGLRGPVLYEQPWV